MDFKPYIERLLRTNVSVAEWQGRKQLPLFIKSQFKNIYCGTISSIRVLFAETDPCKPLENMKHIKVQVEKIRTIGALPVVIVSNRIDRHQRDYMLFRQMPFVVPDKQLYLPFMGTYLQENSKPTPTKSLKRFSPLTQVVFLYYLYSDRQGIYLSDTAIELGITQMSVSRAFSQLSDTGLFTVDKDRRKRRLAGNLCKKDLFERCRKYLINPISDVLYANKNCLHQDSFVESGILALSSISDLAEPRVPCYAIGINSWKKEPFDATSYLLDPDVQFRLEIWKYNPAILTHNNTVDPLSLALSLAEEYDERVEYELEKLLKAIWKDDSVARIR